MKIHILIEPIELADGKYKPNFSIISDPDSTPTITGFSIEGSFDDRDSAIDDSINHAKDEISKYGECEIKTFVEKG